MGVYVHACVAAWASPRSSGPTMRMGVLLSLSVSLSASVSESGCVHARLHARVGFSKIC